MGPPAPQPACPSARLLLSPPAPQLMVAVPAVLFLRALSAVVPRAACNHNSPAGCLPRKTSLCFQPLAPDQPAHFRAGSVAPSPVGVGANEQSWARKANEGKPPGRRRGPLHFRGAPVALEAGRSSCLSIPPPPSPPPPPPALKQGFAMMSLFDPVLWFRETFRPPSLDSPFLWGKRLALSLEFW